MDDGSRVVVVVEAMENKQFSASLESPDGFTSNGSVNDAAVVMIAVVVVPDVMILRSWW